MIPRPAKSDPPELRDREFSNLWSRGGFSFWASNYMDEFSDPASNALIYAYWRDRVRERVHDSQTAELLAPADPPYAFGTKRVPLESSYYDSFNLPHVTLVSTHNNPITSITPTGPVLASGRTFPPLDVLIFATGFDVATGSLTQISLHGHRHSDDNGDGDSDSDSKPPGANITLADKWSRAHQTLTYLGLCTRAFPNAFFPYGPQSPAFTANGPVCAQIQGDFIADVLVHGRAGGFGRVEAEAWAEEAWSARVRGMLAGTLFEGTRNYYWGDNVRGKRRELLAWFGGVPRYEAELEGVRGEGWRGLVFE